MDDSRVSRSKRNIGIGLASQAVYLVFAFITRVLIIRFIGMDSQAINSLAVEVVAALSIAELGIWQAISYSLYKPLADGDEARLASIMNLFRKAYRIIGSVLIVIGIVGAAFVPMLLKDIDVSDSYFRCVYLLILLREVIPYFFSYNLALLNADQRNYVYQRYELVARVATSSIGIAVILYTHNLVAYLCVELVGVIPAYILATLYARRVYPFLIGKSEPLEPDERKAIFDNVRCMFVGKMANKVLNSTDNILISTIVNTVTVGLYSQYSMFTNGFLRLFSQVDKALTGAIGNVIATEDSDDRRDVFENITYLFFIGALTVSICMYLCIDPFLGGIVGKEYLLDRTVLGTVTTVMFLEVLKMPLWTFYGANGMFKSDQYISIVGTVVNLVASIALGKSLGTIGIFIGSIIALSVMVIWKLVLLYRECLGGDIASGVGGWLVYIAIYAICMVCAHRFSTEVLIRNPVLLFVVSGIFGLALCTSLSVLPFVRSRRFSYLVRLAKRGRADAASSS